jgi:hypothetical protein
VVKIERTRIGKVRRAKLTYMRSRKGKSARIAGRDVSLSGKTKGKKQAGTPVVAETPPETEEDRVQEAAAAE